MSEDKKLEGSKVYSTFKAKDINSEKIVEYRVQNLPEDRFEDAIEVLLEGLKDEPISVSRKTYENEETKKEVRGIWQEMLKKGLSVGCFKENGEIVGANVLSITIKDEEDHFEGQDKNIKDMIASMKYTNKEADIFSKYNVDKYLSSLGLCVDRNYRRRGIAKEILKARSQIMKDLGLKLSVTTFSAVGSQKAAESVGFEDAYVISFKDLKNVSPDFDFVNELSDFYKIMALKI